jgi:hypothetical protein
MLAKLDRNCTLSGEVDELKGLACPEGSGQETKKRTAITVRYPFYSPQTLTGRDRSNPNAILLAILPVATREKSYGAEGSRVIIPLRASPPTRRWLTGFLQRNGDHDLA